MTYTEILLIIEKFGISITIRNVGFYIEIVNPGLGHVLKHVPGIQVFGREPGHVSSYVTGTCLSTCSIRCLGIMEKDNVT